MRHLVLAFFALVAAVMIAGLAGAGDLASAGSSRVPYDGVWSATLTGTVTEGSATGPATVVSCCNRPTRFSVENGMITRGDSSILTGSDQFDVWSLASISAGGDLWLSATIAGLNDRADPPLPCDFQVRFTSAGESNSPGLEHSTSAASIGTISCQANNSAHDANPFLNKFQGTFQAVRVSAPISCALAKALERSRVRPVWFPFPEPHGRLSVNASVPIFGPGLEWSTGPHYLFLGRVPGGANLGAPFPSLIETVYLANFQAKLKIYRLAKVEGSRLYADWQTSTTSRADLTYAVANGETAGQFVAFLGSLQHVIWPTGCG